MPTSAPSLDDLYDAAGYKYNVDPLRIKAHAVQETGERANVPSADGKSDGFGQFRPETWGRVMPGVPLSARRDPETAIEAMAKFIAANDDAHRDASGRVDLNASTAAYNGSGPAADAYARNVQGVYGRLAASGGLKLSGQAADKPGAAAANDDAFGQTLKGSPKPSGGDEAPDAFAATLKGGPAKTPASDPTAGYGTPPGMTLPRSAENPEGAPNPAIPLPAPVQNILEAGAKGAAEGFGNPLGQTILSPMAQNALDEAQRQGGIKGKLAQLGSTVATDIGTGLGVAGGAVNALFRGAQGIVSQTGAELGQPQAGRDIAALPEAFMGSPHAFNALDVAGARKLAMEPNPLDPAVARARSVTTEMTPAQREAFANGRPMPPAADIAPPGATAAPGDATPTGPAAGAPTAPLATDQAWIAGMKNDVQAVMDANKALGVPGDLSAAATPEQLAKLTPQQMKAYRRQAELGEILRPPQSGEDTTIHVEGATPTRAEWKGDPIESQSETLLRQRQPDAYTGANGQLTINNRAMVNSFEDMAGSDPQIQAINDRLKAAAQRDTTAVMAHARDGDLQPVLDTFNTILNDPRLAERDAVQKVIAPLKAKLLDADGNLKTDPAAIWGMHDNIMDKLEDSKLDSKTERLVTGQLLQIKQAVDAAMNKATGDHFQTFLDNQAALLKERNGLQVLQKFRPQFTNKAGDINANAFHRWLTGLAVKRGAAGVDATMDIPDATMRGLMNIDNHLKRATNIDLGKARGSPTNLFYSLAQGLGIGGAHGIVALAGLSHGGMGNIALQHGLSYAGEKLNMLRLNSRVKRSLKPPPGGFNHLSQSDYP